MVQEMRDEEDNILKQRQLISDRTYTRIRLILSAAFILVVAGLFLNFRRLWRELRERSQAEESIRNLDRAVEKGEDPAVFQGEGIHVDPFGILGREVSMFMKTKRAPFQILLAKFLNSSKRRRSRSICRAWVALAHRRHAHGIGAIVVDDFEGIDDVAFGLGHLFPFGVDISGEGLCLDHSRAVLWQVT